jgi:nucleoside-diphosphate-sugar epimerase
LRQFLAGAARLEGKGERYINMIHRDDLVGIILAALKNGRPGQIYNAVDDEPVTQFHLFRWLADTLGQELPPAESQATPDERKRGSTHKKVLNRKLKMELGYTFKYPNFRYGYTAEIQRLDLPPSP